MAYTCWKAYRDSKWIATVGSRIKPNKDESDHVEYTPHEYAANQSSTSHKPRRQNFKWSGVCEKIQRKTRKNLARSLFHEAAEKDLISFEDAEGDLILAEDQGCCASMDQEVKAESVSLDTVIKKFGLSTLVGWIFWNSLKRPQLRIVFSILFIMVDQVITLQLLDQLEPHCRWWIMYN